MSNKRSSWNIGRTIIKAITIFPTITSLVGNIAALIDAEARATKHSIAHILMMQIFMCALLTSTWFVLLGMLLLFMVETFHYSWLVGLSILLLINVLLMLLVVVRIKRIKKHLFFPETRQVIRDIIENI